jgi:putative two-component system response regulator
MNQEKPLVLVVDDEPFYTEVLKNLLRNEYDVVVVDNGEDALKTAKNSPQPDLIMLDIVLPGIDGYEVCRLLKEDISTADIPVIFLTIKGDVDDEVRGFNLGAVDYITKPMSPPIVKARARTHIKVAQLVKQLEWVLSQLKM